MFIVSHPLTVIALDADNDGVTNTVGGSADNDESSNNDVCDNTEAASSSACDGSVNNDSRNKDDEDDDDDDLYELPDIEWCRRRPTWRNNDHDDDNDSSNHTNENYVREYCSKLLNYYPNLEILTKGRHPYLSSSYTTRYKFHDDDIFDEMEKQNDTYNNIPNILDRPLIKQLYKCMDDDDELQNELWKSSHKSNSESSRMVRPSIKKIHRRKNDNNDGDNENKIGDKDNDGLLPIMIIVEDSINEIEAQYVISLSKCLRSHPPLQEYIFEARKFEGTSRDDSGNDVTFLAGFLQILLPGIANQIHQIAYLVWNETKWGDRDIGDFAKIMQSVELTMGGSVVILTNVLRLLTWFFMPFLSLEAIYPLCGVDVKPEFRKHLCKIPNVGHPWWLIIMIGAILSTPNLHTEIPQITKLSAIKALLDAPSIWT
ncbi:hypothetical protein FRACYDRAFT_246322 [Fragilariopsis cylindrus CCMP1102]|uniref:Uncharacterized protein n=1 Tax=Fragilariopsis cylindrus CCMP1102 TaxID=635003 RepID=A0A1E7EZE5_9STRA|nr:hypothetical protein FRACYDRAFT_246322 [Fragilariopsis cylindrus CCMP1102]|eukprot:OEU11209.1 hypothetical protein FRACYDRAFT_246322 [Fragilariopsis cylindrus CCMP1102]